MSKVSVLAKITAQPGKRDEVAALLQTVIDVVSKDEPGTLLYILNTDRKSEDVLWMYELYENRDALTAHMNGEEFKAMGPKLMELVASQPELIIGEALAGKGA
jgi:quinol monooxygenase YgiN